MVVALQLPQHSFMISNVNNRLLSFSDSMEDCGQDGDILKIDSLDISPDPPQRGQDLTVLLTGTLSQDVVKGSKAQVKVKLGFIQLLDQQFDLCEKSSTVDMDCPIRKGPIEINKSFAIPNELPKGRYNLHVETTNADGSRIACVQAQFRM